MAKGPPAYRLRPMTEADLPAAAAIYASTRTEELAATGWSELQKQAFLTQQHAAQHAHYRAHYPGADWLMVELDGQIAGRLYRVVWPREIRIIDIALLPPFRGQGIGADIVGRIIEEAAGLDKAVSIHVEKNNPARTLYRRLGFQVAADRGVYDLMEWRAPAGENGPQ